MRCGQAMFWVLRVRFSWIAWILGIAWLGGFGCGNPDSKPVVVYCAQDQVYAESILADFTQQTGIPVKPVYDSEAIKTVGLVNRLMAERRHPNADVFWGNEELRTRQLIANGVLMTEPHFGVFGQRRRLLVIRRGPMNSSLATIRSWADLTNQAFFGRLSMAFPLFGSTATHLLALRPHWGESNWVVWCRALIANQPFLEEGNSQVVQRVARGEALVGMTDSDDLTAAQRQGLAVESLPLMSETLYLPNTVAIVAGAPNPIGANRLLQHLLSKPVEQQLIALGALESPRNETKHLGLRPNWDVVLRDMDAANSQLMNWFRK